MKGFILGILVASMVFFSVPAWGDTAPGTMWPLGPTTVAVETAYPIRSMKNTQGVSMYPWISPGDNVTYTLTPMSVLKLNDWIVVDWTKARGRPMLVIHAVYSIEETEDGWKALTTGWHNGGFIDPVEATQENYVGKAEVIWKK